MRQIHKTPEPDSFRRWKASGNDDWAPNWEDFRNPEKPELHRSLLREQGWLCCYCTQRIEEDSSHIEHLKPQRDFPWLALDYGNLLACCEGGAKDTAPRQIHCDQRKGHWYDAALFVSPLDADCEAAFRFTARGEIRADDQHPRHAAATETIRRLNLGCAKLERARREAIDPVASDLDRLTDADIVSLYRGLQSPNANGELEPFLPAILHVLKGLIP